MSCVCSFLCPRTLTRSPTTGYVLGLFLEHEQIDASNYRQLDCSQIDDSSEADKYIATTWSQWPLDSGIPVTMNHFCKDVWLTLLRTRIRVGWRRMPALR